jgi:cell division protein FtsQ
MAVARPAADKRFRRAHVKPAGRPWWRARWRLVARAAVLLAVIGYATYRVGELLLSSSALTVTRVTVSGNSRMSKGEVLSLLDGVRGTNMLMADLEGWRKKLLTAPWVAEATMRRVFPGTLAVAVTERQPLGIGRINDNLYLIDQRATIIDEYGPNYAELDLPIIDGLAAGTRGDGLLIDSSRAYLAARLLVELRRRPELARRVSQIDVSDVRDAVVILEGDSTMLRVGDDRFAERLQSYIDLAPALRERVPAIDYVDLRYDQRVYVRPLGGSAHGRKAKS